jgi:tetratricopeptide (TPR) repeat protein
MLYNSKCYESAAKGYDSLYNQLSHRSAFLFEGAQCLSNTCHLEKAIKWLRRTKQLNGDTMIRYVIAKNEQALGYYQQAEKTLLQAIHILPERVYPYYLLAKLYAEPGFYQP